EPSADGAVGEVAARLAMAGIVEARHRPAMIPRPLIERFGLGAAHIGFEAAEPEQARCRALPHPDGNAPGCGTGSNAQEFQARIVHGADAGYRAVAWQRSELRADSIERGAVAYFAARRH